MKALGLTSSRIGPGIVRTLCKALPPAIAYRAGDCMATVIVRCRDAVLVQAVRANLAAVLSLPEEHPHVESSLQSLFQNLARAYIDLFQALDRGKQAVYDACPIDPSLVRVLEGCRARGQGIILVGAHTCSFDLLLLGLKRHLPSCQILTQADPPGNSQFMNQIRGEFGLNITPISVHGLRQAIRCLESGGAVVIAADVPIEQGESLTFMGRPCRLPLGHARLAMKTGAQMIFGASRRRADGLYEAVGAPIPKPESAGDRREEERQWAQAAASRMENYIRKRPTEWFMPHRLWPEQSRGASADGRLRYSLNAV